MKNIVLLGLLVLLLVAVQFANGKTVDEIIEKHIQAIGGFDKAYKIESIYMEGVIKTHATLNFVKIFKEKNKFGDEPVSFNTRWQITDTENSLATPQHSNTDIKSLNDAIAGMLTEPEISATLLSYSGPGYKPVLAGTDILDQKTYYKIMLSLTSGSQINYWLASTGFQLTQVLITPDESRKLKEKSGYTLYSNYKTIQGIPMAHRIEIVDGDSNSPIKIVFSKIEIDQHPDLNFSNHNNQC
jgi:hypothetical protein